MKTLIANKKTWAGLILSVLLGVTSCLHAEILGTTGTTFNLKASGSYIYTPDGGSILVWGYGLDTSPYGMQYPGPTLIVNQGDTVTINLTNTLNVPVSMMFPGMDSVVASGGVDGLITKEVPAGSLTAPSGPVTYTFTATNPGTYYYQSATNIELQTEMGLFGAIVVRPAAAKQAYNHADTAYDHEYLFLLSEMDPRVHDLVDFGLIDTIDNTDYWPVYWFVNGRNGPDTLAGANVPWMPNQPLDALARVTPGKKALMRVINMSRDMHPFHTHGNNYVMIARDGHMLSSGAGAGTDLATEDYTLGAVPGATYDALWQWTGEALGWDVFGTDADISSSDPMYGHTCNGSTTPTPGYDSVTGEYCPDHGKKLPVTLPGQQDLTFGGFYSGSPFLGAFGSLPPGEGGLNLNAGMFYMWHSHTERELTNNDIYPGGLLTLMLVEPPWVTIP